VIWRRLVTWLIWAAIVWLAGIALGFLFLNLIPGNAAVALLEGGASAERLAQMTSTLQLDQPALARFAQYLTNVLHLEFGRSLLFGQPVWQLVTQRIPLTLALTATATLLAACAGTALGVWAAMQPTNRIVRLCLTAADGVSAIPPFLMALLLILLANALVPSLPISGVPRLGAGTSAMDFFFQWCLHLLLPVATLALFYAPAYVRMAQLQCQMVLPQDFIRTARAKGLAGWGVGRHAAIHLAIPFLSLLELQVGAMFSGAMLVESVFSLPGLGSLILDATAGRDYLLLLGAMQLCVFGVLVAGLGFGAIKTSIYARSSLDHAANAGRYP
jgi:peptide/nickel transport system permease protein